jgi:hypothetical protein
MDSETFGKGNCNAKPLAITDKVDFKTKVRASMRQLQDDPEKIRSFYQKPSLEYSE